MYEQECVACGARFPSWWAGIAHYTWKHLGIDPFEEAKTKARQSKVPQLESWSRSAGTINDIPWLRSNPRCPILFPKQFQ